MLKLVLNLSVLNLYHLCINPNATVINLNYSNPIATFVKCLKFLVNKSTGFIAQGIAFASCSKVFLSLQYPQHEHL